ncbi:hypothetical protein DMH15_16060 [Streptomyces sp. WAC 06725]|uniref:hypothetical protein n=1 Tax=Streptomyces sp. WAC 06725 TaxID=2203209 RepID=UPI000F7370FC|nr:hypothetical protein [Streptomyces sp. WAC 06725]RSO40134.1 hypothetical protein DMH15_16060 [Streptomyces sp. WAC 06725]
MAEQQPTRDDDAEAEARVRYLQAQAAVDYARHNDPETAAAARDQSATGRAHGNENGGYRG